MSDHSFHLCKSCRQASSTMMPPCQSYSRLPCTLDPDLKRELLWRVWARWKIRDEEAETARDSCCPGCENTCTQWNILCSESFLTRSRASASGSPCIRIRSMVASRTFCSYVMHNAQLGVFMTPGATSNSIPNLFESISHRLCDSQVCSVSPSRTDRPGERIFIILHTLAMISYLVRKLSRSPGIEEVSRRLGRIVELSKSMAI